MRDWVVVPCLAVLRSEFNTVSPNRDKGSDGTKGDSAHNASSDHTPDEESDVLRDKDDDDKNEVHALDIDSTGPWPGGPEWFDRAIKRIVERHRTGKDNRLQYVIWNHKIANRSIDNWRWRTYTSTTDPHTGHAHFSSRYTTAQENDTSAWGVINALLEDDDMNWNDVIQLTPDTKAELTDVDGVMTIGSLIQTIAIWAARGGKNSAMVLNKMNVIADDEAPIDQRVAALRVLLGNDAKAIGQILAS